MKKKNLFLTIACFCLALFAKAETTDISSLENVIYAESLSCTTGSSFAMSVKMKNKVGVTGFQFDLELPSGITVEEDADGFYLIDLSTERTTTARTNYFDSAKQPDNSVRVMASSTKNYTFSGNDGEVAIINISVADDVAEGKYPIVLKNIVLSDAAANSYETERVEIELTVGSESVTYDEGYSVSIVPFVATTGKAYTIALNFDAKDEDITDIEFDMELPSFLSRTKSGRVTKAFESADDERMYVDGSEGDHTITINGNHVTIASIVNDEYKYIAGTSGALVNMYYTSAATIEEGLYPVKFTNITMFNGDGKSLSLAPTTSYIKVGNPTNATFAVDGYVSAELNESLAAETSIGTLDMSKVASMNGTLTLVEGRNFVAPKSEVDVECVTYTRSLVNEYGTICLPFEVESDANVQYYKLTSVSETTMIFETVDMLQAGEPALFKNLSGNFLSIDASNVVIKAGIKEKSQEATGWTIVGTYEEQNMGNADYIIANNKFWNAGLVSDANGGAKVKVAPFRAYFQKVSAETKAASLSISVDDEKTAIETISRIPDDNAEFYDINGRKTTGLHVGINIIKLQNGRVHKVIIK